VEKGGLAEALKSAVLSPAPPALPAPTVPPAPPASLEPPASPAPTNDTPTTLVVVRRDGAPEVWFGDEMRVGLHGQSRRIWAPIGEKVVQVVQIVYVWTYLCLAVNPLQRALRWTWIPNLKGATLAPVLTIWKACGVDVLVWDGAPGHRSPLVRAVGMPLVTLPPYSPELDPAERIFRELRREVEGEVYDTLATKRTRIDTWLQALAAAPDRLASLTAWSWVQHQLTTAFPLRPIPS
jgi:DDE superfamily endonuclease